MAEKPKLDCESCFINEVVEGRLFCEECDSQREKSFCWCHYEFRCDECLGIPPDRMMVCEVCMESAHGPDQDVPLRVLLEAENEDSDEDEDEEKEVQEDYPTFTPKTHVKTMYDNQGKEEMIQVTKGGKYGTWFVPAGAWIPKKLFEEVMQ